MPVEVRGSMVGCAGVRTDRSAPGLQEGKWLRSHGKASSPAFGMVRAADGHLWWGDRCHIRRVQREGQQPGSGNEEQVGRLPCLFSSRPRRGSAWERQRGCGSGSGGSQAEAGEQPNVGRAPRWASDAGVSVPLARPCSVLRSCDSARLSGREGRPSVPGAAFLSDFQFCRKLRQRNTKGGKRLQ